MIDLSIVIVNWNVRQLLKRCLRSIFDSIGTADAGQGPPATGIRFEVIVVDNASSDGSVTMVREDFPQVRLIANESNLGFTRGNNQAIACSRGRYVLLLNPDTVVVRGALTTMVRYMDAHPRVGGLGPQLLNPDGSVQSSRRRFPTMATAFLESTIFQRWVPCNSILRRFYVLDRSDEETQEVDWVVGACLLMRREAIDQVGPLDEDYFMYSEELDWCYRLKERGWKVVYLPTAQVIHHEGKSSEQVVPTRHIHFQRSKVLFFRKHGGLWRAEILRLFLLTTYLYQWIEEALKWLVGHKRPLRRARMGAYWQVLRSGLK